MDNKWQAGNGTRQCAIHAMVEVECDTGYAPPAPGPLRADTVAWAHVYRWRLADAGHGWIDWGFSPPSMPLQPDLNVEIMTAHGDLETGKVSSFNWTVRGADTIVRYRVVPPPTPMVGSPEHHAAYVHQSVAEHDRLSAIIEAKDVALRAAEVRSSELEFERDQARTDLVVSRDAVAILESENATLRKFGVKSSRAMLDVTARLTILHHNLNIAALRDCLPLDFDEQLLEWVK